MLLRALPDRGPSPQASDPVAFRDMWAGMSARRRLICWLFIVLVVLNVALPKGGVMAGEIPITFGYVFAGLVGGLAVLGVSTRSQRTIAPVLQVGTCFLPISLLIILKTVAYNQAFTSAAIYLVQFLVLPVLVLGVLAPYLEEIPGRVIDRALVWAVRFTVVFGLINFILFPALGTILNVPYLTINSGDYEDVFSKNNRRGMLMKLFSTYNNGNLYGDCMILLAPMYLLFERSKAWAGALVLALVCTLSRTVWFGVLGCGGLMILSGQIDVKRPRVWGGIVMGFCVILAVLPLMGWDMSSIFDSDLGGRSRLYRTFELTFFGKPQLSIPELVYLGFLNSFGVAGFMFAVGALAFAPLYGLVQFGNLSPLRKAAVIGTISYMVIAMIDGAFIFPPMMLQFLFVSGLIYRRGLRPDVETASWDHQPWQGALRGM